VVPLARMITRRAFIQRSTLALGGALVGGCAARGTPASAAGATTKLTPATERALPLLEVSGEPHAIGYAVGRHVGAALRELLAARAAWFRDLKVFARSQPASLHATFIAAAKKHAPAAYAELRGLAAGAQLPLDEMEILHLESEYEALKAKDDRTKPPASAPGCSTLALRHGETMLVCHNEDNHVAYARMSLLRLRPEGKPAVLCAAYPGMLPGGAPWINAAGLAMTNNYIAAREVRVGVGSYFLAREAMHARTLDAAIAIYTHPQRTYANHYTLGSAAESRLVSLELTPSRHSLQEIDGLLIHTNHLLHPTLADEPQDQAYVQSSSMSRLRVLTRWRDALEDPRRVTRDQMVGALSSHEGRPYSPCRHPQGDVHGATLLTAAIDLPRRSMRIYRGQPCRGVFSDYAAPAAV
jgi:hypothetical protein